MTKVIRQYLYLVLLSWSLKLLLIPAYYSTDFQVHQNWLRITENLPLSKWYYDDQSKWTLDYPPFFAYFQLLLAKVAKLINPQIVSTINTFTITVYFQRISVILTDLVYLLSLGKYFKWKLTLRLILLYLFIPFIILDNIHFQYNLMLQSLLVLSIYFMENQKYLASALTYSVLLNTKHIYLYCAPAYFIYLLLFYVTKPQTSNQSSMIMRLFKLGTVTVIPFVLSFSPFYLTTGIDGISQIFTQLFPFGRGLIHEFWAPNVWALYHLSDKILFSVLNRFPSLFKYANGSIITYSQNSNTHTLRVLPEVSPLITISLILIFIFPLFLKVIKLYKQQINNQNMKRINFTSLVSMSGFIFFMFGFHVHQKAITPYLSLLFMFVPDTKFLNLAIFVNIVNLVPLIIEPGEQSLCIIISLLWIAMISVLKQNKQKENLFQNIDDIFKYTNIFQVLAALNLRQFLEDIIKITGLILVLYYCVVSKFIKSDKLQFMPIMLNSVWAAMINLIWISSLYVHFIKKGTLSDQKQKQ